MKNPMMVFSHHGMVGLNGIITHGIHHWQFPQMDDVDHIRVIRGVQVHNVVLVMDGVVASAGYSGDIRPTVMIKDLVKMKDAIKENTTARRRRRRRRG